MTENENLLLHSTSLISFWVRKCVLTGNSSSVRDDKVGTSDLLIIYASVPIANKVCGNGAQMFIAGLCTLAEPR